MTFTEQTGYRRPHPCGICQDHDFLLAVTHCDFDLSDPQFVDYFEGRTGVQLWDTGPYKTPRSRTFEEWDDMVAEIENGTETPARILRGRLQDCWELYQTVDRGGNNCESFRPAHRAGNVSRDLLGEDMIVVTASPGYVCPPLLS